MSLRKSFFNANILFSDSIESHVEHAALHVEEGNKQLVRAKSYQVRDEVMFTLSKVKLYISERSQYHVSMTEVKIFKFRSSYLICSIF